MGNLRTEGFRDVAKVDNAIQTLLSALDWRAPKPESVKIIDALNRILAENIVSRKFLPPADRSIVDGYAVISTDTANATESKPTRLAVVGESRIGEPCHIPVKLGQAIAVATGSTVPQGTDAVVMVERTKKLQDGSITIDHPVFSGQHISKKGEDLSPGTPVLSKGHRLRPQDLGILKALGFSRIEVAKRPRVGIVSTGNELTDFVGERDPAKVIEVSRTILSGMATELGASPVDLGIARDKEAEILRVLKKGLRTCDIVLITAGSSVGKRDLVPECINKLGKPGMLVHGVGMRPSLPTGLAVVDEKPVLSLPGFPVSTIVAFRVFGPPLIARFMGADTQPEPVLKAVLKERVTAADGFRTFVRVKVTRTVQGLVAEPLRIQRSAVLMSMVAANGIVTIPEDLNVLEAGQTVDVTIIGEIGR